jgi:biotin carboxylase
MKLLIIHRIPYHKIAYHRGLDHQAHEVTYIGTQAALANIPAELRCEKLERPGVKGVAEEVIDIMRHEPRPDRVISLSEYELLDAARVREALGVEGPTYAEVELVRDKMKMKAAVEAHGLRVPRFMGLQACLAGEERPSWRGRTVLKPVSGASSENISLFDSPDEALARVRETLGAGGGLDPVQFELEEFIEGPIFHVDGLVQNGKPVAMLASRYVGTCLEYAQGGPLGSIQMQMDPELCAWAERCLEAVALRSSSFHLEGILSPEGPVFLEIAARVGGADVVDCFELAMGIHMPSVELAFLVGETPELRRSNTLSAPDMRFGWFVFPGHLLGGEHCRISGAERFHSHPFIVRWNQLTPDKPLPKNITYQAIEAPVAGIVGRGTTEELEVFLRDMFATLRIEPCRKE